MMITFWKKVKLSPNFLHILVSYQMSDNTGVKDIIDLDGRKTNIVQTE